MTAGGNFEGHNIPVRATSDPPNREELRGRFYEARAARVAGPRRQAPDRLERARWSPRSPTPARCSGVRRYPDAAVTARTSSLTTMRDDDGRLLRTYNRGQARLRAYLEDHASCSRRC